MESVPEGNIRGRQSARKGTGNIGGKLERRALCSIQSVGNQTHSPPVYIYIAITQEGGTGPDVKTIRTYLTRLRRVITILVRYRDQKTVVEDLQSKQKTLDAMLAAALNDDTNDDVHSECRMIWLI